MAILNDLVVTGQSRLLNKLYASSGIEVTGSETINKGGLLVSNYYNENGLSGQIVLKSNTGNAFIMRVDSTNMYFLLSSSNTDYTYNSLRPFYINTSTGQITMNKVNLSGALYVNSTATIVGSTTFHTGITVNGTTATTSLTASTGLFTNCQVLDTLRTTTWSLDNVTSLGGHFYVSPTLFFSSSTTATISAISGTTVTMAIKDSNSIKSNSAGGVTWPSGAKVKLSGRLGNVALGTCTGTLTTAMNATAGTITLTFTFDNASSLSVKAYAASEIHNLAIMMYNNGTYPVGIAMTSYGTNGYSYIDIYGGSTAANNPNVRIGKLDGLPAVNGTSPKGWGLYTTHGFFSGTIVSTAGKIGGYTLSTYNLIGNNVGISSQSGYEFAFWAGSNTSSSAPFRVGHEGTLYCTQLSATGGTIGGFKITGEYLCSNPDRVGMSATNSNWAFYAGYDSSTGKAPFQVKNDGTLICSNINASGGTIGKYTITSTYLTTGSGTSCTGMGGNQAFWAGADSSNSAPFRVSYAGALVATNATITGSITATSGSIAGSLVTSGINASNITTGTLSADRIAAGAIAIGKLASGLQTTINNASTNASSAINSLTIKDTRSNNQNPSWYMTNYPKTIVREFKTCSAIGLSVSSSTYCTLETKVPWSDSSGGYPTQVATVGNDNKVYKRVGTSGTTWSSWVSADQIIANWCYNNDTTYINGAKIYTGTITALGAVTAGSFNLGNGNFTVSSSGVMTCKGATISGAVTATSMTANTYYAIYTGSTSTRFIYYDAPEIRIGLPATSTGDLSDLLAGFSFHSSGQTQCWGSLTVSNTLTAPYLKATIDVTAPTVNAATVIGNTWHSSTYGGGWYMSDTTWIRSYGSKSIYHNSGIMRTDGTLQVGADGAYFNSNSSGTKIGGKLSVTYSGVGGVTVQGSETTTGIQITRTDTNYGLRVGMSSSNTQGIWACDYNTSSSTAIIYRKPSDASATTYLPDRIVMSGAYGTSAPPTSGTLVKGMVYFQIIS